MQHIRYFRYIFQGIVSLISSKEVGKWALYSLMIIKRVQICHPKLCHFGIWIILSWWQLRINRCRKTPSQSFLYLTKSRNFWEIRTARKPLPEGILWVWKRWKVSTLMSNKQTLLNDIYLPYICYLIKWHLPAIHLLLIFPQFNTFWWNDIQASESNHFLDFHFLLWVSTSM